MNINSAFPSQYLKQADLGGKRVLVTIDRVTVEDVGQGESQERKPVLYFKGHEKGMVLNKTNAWEITAIVGSDDTDHWPESKVVLYVDPNVMYAGKKVGGIRIAAPPSNKPVPIKPPQPEMVEGFAGADDDGPPL